MSTLEIREIDPSDEALLRAWWQVGHAASAERPFEAWPAWEVSRLSLPARRTDVTRTLLGAFADGTPIGAGLLMLTMLDNTHLAQLEVYVAPGHRRRGIGAAVLAAAEDQARAVGRTVAVGSVFAPVDLESPGLHFATRNGYAPGSDGETKLLDLASAVAAWEVLDAEVAAALGDYELRVFEDRIPEEYVDDFCALLSVFVGSLPAGDLDVGDTAWTPERLRAGEARHAASGCRRLIAVAVAPDGHLCGFTDLAVYPADPRHALVGGTLVLPEHRGQRLGLGMKLLTHRRLVETLPACAFVETDNTGVNAPMNAVNEKLGYRVVERCLGLQKRLA